MKQGPSAPGNLQEQAALATTNNCYILNGFKKLFCDTWTHPTSIL